MRVNIAYRDTLEAAGLRFSGMSPDGVLPEIVEISDHRGSSACSSHPELKSRPFDSAPAVTSFVKAASISRGWCKRGVIVAVGCGAANGHGPIHKP